MPYLFIRIAVATIDPLVIAFGRTLIGAMLLLPMALNRKALGPAFRQWRWLLVFTVVEISGPWLLIGHAETRLNSSTTGLIIAMVPLFAALLVAGLGHERLERHRIGGLALGFLGVATIVGLDLHFSDMGAAAALVVSALGYAIGPIIINRKLADAPPIGVVTGSLILATLIYSPFVPLLWPEQPGFAGIIAVSVLGLICTATAFMFFFALIAEIGPARATVIAYIKPVVAVTEANRERTCMPAMGITTVAASIEAGEAALPDGRSGAGPAPSSSGRHARRSAAIALASW